MKKRIPLLVICILVVAAAGGFWWYYFGPLSVDVVAVRKGPAVQAVYGSGSVEASVMVPIKPKIAGRLVTLAADERAHVKKGQILAQLDSRELQASVAEWEARVRFGKTQFQRAAELYKNRSGTAVARDQAKNELDVARASLDRARKQLAETRLVAPADGVIIRRDGEIGQLIQPGEAVFWMSCCDGLRVSAEIDEEDIPLIRPGQAVAIRADAFPDRLLKGTVTEITPKGDPIARSFRVRIKLPTETPLMIGMTADCNIIVAERPDALLIPVSAISNAKVWIVRDGILSQQSVKIGVAGNGFVEVKSGLGETERVVIRPASGLREGRKATVNLVREP